MAKARKSCPDDLADAWIDELRLSREAITSAIKSKTQVFERRGAGPANANKFGVVVARLGRTGPATSTKVSNISREVSRTVYAAVLFAMAEVYMLDKPAPARVLGALVAFAFAAFSATRATITYNDACVLHKAWQIAGRRSDRAFSRDEILAAREVIATEYHAPKCGGEKDIDDVLENLVGLKAIARTGDQFTLKERIIFYADGHIRN